MTEQEFADQMEHTAWRNHLAKQADDAAADRVAAAMADYLATVEGHEVDNTGDCESIFIHYGASGGGAVEINLFELAKVAMAAAR